MWNDPDFLWVSLPSIHVRTSCHYILSWDELLTSLTCPKLWCSCLLNCLWKDKEKFFKNNSTKRKQETTVHTTYSACWLKPNIVSTGVQFNWLFSSYFAASTILHSVEFNVSFISDYYCMTNIRQKEKSPNFFEKFDTMRTFVLQHITVLQLL